MSTPINSAYTLLGASNRTEAIREENDFYATEPKALELLLKLETFSPTIWECACGQGHLSEVLWNHGYYVQSSDLIDRGYGESGVDFLVCTEPFPGDIITNPPYKHALQFVEHALELIPRGNKVAFFCGFYFSKGKSAASFSRRTRRVKYMLRVSGLNAPKTRILAAGRYLLTRGIFGKKDIPDRPSFYGSIERRVLK